MKMRTFIPLAIVVFIICTAVIYTVSKYVQEKFSPEKKVAQEIQPIAKNEPLATCTPGDQSCTTRNEKIMINKLTGTAVEYAKHQCDGPHACPTPKPEVSDAAVASIRTYAKDKKLELTRMTGINPKNLVFYCATGNRCWTYDVKEKKVTSFMNGGNSVSPTP